MLAEKMVFILRRKFTTIIFKDFFFFFFCLFSEQLIISVELLVGVFRIEALPEKSLATVKT